MFYLKCYIKNFGNYYFACNDYKYDSDSMVLTLNIGRNNIIDNIYNITSVEEISEEFFKYYTVGTYEGKEKHKMTKVQFMILDNFFKNQMEAASYTGNCSKELSMLKDLYNKEKPKKPHYEYGICSYGEADYDLWICPNCGKSYVADFGIYERCTHCGQVIDWTPEEKNDKART